MPSPLTNIVKLLSLYLSTAVATPHNEASQSVLSLDQLPLPFATTSTLNFSSPSPHIFGSLFGLLQQWPNTFFPFGHTLVPCEVPVNTNLYHCRIDDEIPPSPEWFAFDAEMSYAIAGTTERSRLLTYRTTKAVKCLYFDGASASLNGEGNTESQMVFIYNSSEGVPKTPSWGRGPGGDRTENGTEDRPRGGPLVAEYERAKGLCEYIKQNNLGGLGWGYEGVVRMNAAFELIWCDFESPSARLVSQINVTVPVLVEEGNVESTSGHRRDLPDQDLLIRERLPVPSKPANARGGRPFWRSAQLGWLLSGVQQYGFFGGTPGRGEVRVKLDSCGAFTFYDHFLVDQEDSRIRTERVSLNLTAEGRWQQPARAEDRNAALQIITRRRRYHRINNVTTSDGVYMNTAVLARLKAFLSPPESQKQCSGIDWHQAIQDIVLHYSANLQDMHTLLNTSIPSDAGMNATKLNLWLSPMREMAHLFAMPFFVYPPERTIEDNTEEAFSRESDLAREAFMRCRDQYVPVSLFDLAGSERLTYDAITDVLSAICHTTLDVFLSLETIWYSRSTAEAQASKFGLRDLSNTIRSLRYELEELMAWLGWADQWTACEPGCGKGQMCLIPMWPLNWFGSGDGGPGRGGEPGGGYNGGKNGTGSEIGPGSGPGRRRGGPDGTSRSEEGLWTPICVTRTASLFGIT